MRGYQGTCSRSIFLASLMYILCAVYEIRVRKERERKKKSLYLVEREGYPSVYPSSSSSSFFFP